MTNLPFTATLTRLESYTEPDMIQWIWIAAQSYAAEGFSTQNAFETAMDDLDELIASSLTDEANYLMRHGN